MFALWICYGWPYDIHLINGGNFLQRRFVIKNLNFRWFSRARTDLFFCILHINSTNTDSFNTSCCPYSENCLIFTTLVVERLSIMFHLLVCQCVQLISIFAAFTYSIFVWEQIHLFDFLSFLLLLLARIFQLLFFFLCVALHRYDMVMVCNPN